MISNKRLIHLICRGASFGRFGTRSSESFQDRNPRSNEKFRRTCFLHGRSQRKLAIIYIAQKRTIFLQNVLTRLQKINIVGVIVTLKQKWKPKSTGTWATGKKLKLNQQANTISFLLEQRHQFNTFLLPLSSKSFPWWHKKFYTEFLFLFDIWPNK